MTTRNNIADLAHWIETVLKQGFRLSESVLGFIEATFGTTDLANILKMDTGSDIDSLMELLLFPDMEQKMAYELKWGDATFTLEDLTAVQDLICIAPVTVFMKHPDDSEPVRVTVPDFALRAFVQRLNITWHPPLSLVNTLVQHWQGEAANRARVHLRHSRLDWHTSQIRLMKQLLTAMPPDTEDAQECVVFLLSILSELTPCMDPFQFLIAKKFFYFSALCKAENFERQRQASNMEIMMLQGNRAAHGSMAQWRQQMQRIDRICDTIYGKTHFFQSPGDHCVDLQTNDQQQMIEDIIRSLS